MSTAESENYGVFRECVFAVVVDKISVAGKVKALPDRRTSNAKHAKQVKQSFSSALWSEAKAEHSESADSLSDASDLADFSAYIAGEIFLYLPQELQTLSYRTIQDDPDVAETWSLPLTLTAIEAVCFYLPPNVDDNLVAYRLTQPPQSDLQSFMSAVLSAYAAAVTIPPPKWINTKTTSCEICERDWVPLTYHHLIPKQVHAKVLKRGWHEEPQLNSVAWLCRACHSFVHKMASNEELAREWYTVERICQREDVQRWAQWVRRVRWKKT